MGLAFALPTEDRPGFTVACEASASILGRLGRRNPFAWSTQEDWRALTQTAIQDDTKVQNWSVLGAWLEQYGLTGSGRGTFQYVYPQFQEESLQGTVTHAENIAVQMLAEYGTYIGTLFLCLGLAICVMGIYRFWTQKRGILAGAVVAVNAVFLHQGLTLVWRAWGSH